MKQEPKQNSEVAVSDERSVNPFLSSDVNALVDNFGVETLGQKLRARRIEKGYTVQRVAQETKIKVSFIQALENDNYYELPGSVSTIGFIKNYASFLEMHEEYLISLYSAKKKSIEKKVYKKFYLPKKQRFYLDFKTLSLSIALMITSIVLWNLYSKNQNYFYNINSENLQEDEDDLILDSFDEQVNTIDEIDDESDYFEKPNAVNTMQNSIVNAVKFPFPVNRDSSVLQSLKNLSAPILKTSEELNHYQSGDEFLGEAIPNNFQSQILADGFPDRISDMTKHMSLQISDSSANHQIKKDIQVEKKDGSHLNAVQIDSTEEKEEVFEPISESAPDILENSANLNVEQTDTNASSEDE